MTDRERLLDELRPVALAIGGWIIESDGVSRTELV